MANFCTIARDQNKEIQEVYAPNKKPSILFRDIVTSNNDFTKEGKDNALKTWARAYTNSFKKSYGNWELVSEALTYVNEVVPLYRDIFLQQPQRFLFEASVQANSSESELQGALSVYGPNLIRIAKELYPNQAVGSEYKPIVTKPLDENGEPLVSAILNTTEKQRFSRIESTPEVKNLSPIALAEKFSEKMGIPFEFDINLNKLGTIRNGKVIINPNGLSHETVLHEFSHPFVEAIRLSNPDLFKNLGERSKNFTYQANSISDFVKDKYPDLNENSDEFLAEVITTAIGLEAYQEGTINEGGDRKKFTAWLKTVMQKITDFINSLIEDPSQHINPEDLNTSMTIRDLADLMKINNKVNLDILKGRNFSANQNATMTEPVYGSRDTIDFFEEKQTSITLVEEGDISYYTNGTIDPITNTLKKYQRLTEFTHANFARTEDKEPFDAEKWLDKKTTEVFKKANADLSEKIPYGQSSISMSYDEIKKEIKKGYEESRYKGKILHKMIEGFLKHANIYHFQEDIDKIREVSGIGEHDLLWFDTKRVESMIKQLGINSSDFNNKDIQFRDNIASELMMVSESLGIGTSNDGLIEHSDGTVSFIDYKTGAKFLADENTTRRMQYTDGLLSPVYDSRLDRAKIELVTRMIIAKMNKPDLKVRSIKVAYLSRYYGTQIRSVDIQHYLDYINNNYRVSIQELKKGVKKNPELQEKLSQKIREYNAMKSGKVFDFYNYQGANPIFDQDTDLMTITDPIKKEEFLRKKISNEVNKTIITSGEESLSTSKILSLKKELFAVLNRYKSTNVSDVETVGIKDISNVAAVTMGHRDQTNAILQSLSLMYEEVQTRITKRTEKALGEQSQLRKDMRELYKEYFQRTGRTQALGIKTFSYPKGNTPVPLSQQGVYDFMYTWKSVAGENIRVPMTYTQEDVDSKKITATQFKYWNTSTNLSMEHYEAVRNKVAFVDATGKAHSYGEEYIKSDNGYRFDKKTGVFLPTTPFITPEEIIEKNIETGNLNPLNIGKDWFESYRNRYDLSIQNQDKFNIGLPLKYMGSEFVENDEHSFNVTESIDTFVRHMIQKEEMDELYNISMATITLLKDPNNPDFNDRKGRSLLKNVIFELKSWTDSQLLGRRRETFRWTKYEGVNRTLDSLADGVGSFMSKNAFWFAPVTAIGNLSVNSFTLGREALINSVSKRLFGEENAVSSSIIGKALKEVAVHQVKSYTKQSNIKRQFSEDWTGSYYKDKVNWMMKNFRLNNKNYFYSDPSLIMSAHNRIASQDNAYTLQGMSEDIVNEVFMISQMMAMKVYKTKLGDDGVAIREYLRKDGTYTTNIKDSNIKSMWEAYEYNEEEGTFDYTGPTRFLDKDGTEVKGITTLESVKMKTYLERMFGAYSPEQRVHLERWSLGKMLMKFRKFWITNINENFTMEAHKKYVGDYIQLFEKDANGNMIPKLVDGQPIYDWQSQAMRARMFVFISMIGGFLNMKKGKPWSLMTVEEKKQAVRFALSVAILGFILMGGVGLMVPPEDEDKLYVKRMKRFLEDASQIHPVDLLRGTTTLDAYPTQLFRFADATTTFVSALLTDDIVSRGPYKGDYKGWNTLENFIPVYHSYNQTVKLISGE